MDELRILRQSNEECKQKVEEDRRKIQDLEFELKLVREERDKAIGEKYLALAKLKEQCEEVVCLQDRVHQLETSFITMKIEHVNLKSNYESLKDDLDISKKMLQIRDNEIRGLAQAQDLKRTQKTETPKGKDARPPTNKNIRPFPSTSYSFNIISSSHSSRRNSFREEGN